MAPVVGWGVPGAPRAGDTWEFKLSHGDFPASEGWTPEVEIKGVAALTWDATWAVSGTDGWTVTIPATATNLTPGRYEYAVRYIGSAGYAGKEYTVETGTLNVLPNLAEADAGDRQSWYEAQLAVVRSVLAGRITDDIASYTIGGRQVIKMPLKDLLALEASLASKVARLRRGGALEIPVEVWA